MNREERAKAYARTVPIPFAPDKVTKVILDGLEQAYLAGAKDAEDFPAWRMCEDELPYSNEDVFVAFDNGDRGIGYYEGIGEWYVSGIGVVDNIVAWLPLPKFNPKQETEMKAIRKSDGQVVEVEKTVTYNATWSDHERIYDESDLDFNLPEEEALTISLANLREVLNEYSKEKNLMIDDFDTDEIIDRIKQELK